jgi:hypothetical protein
VKLTGVITPPTFMVELENLILVDIVSLYKNRAEALFRLLGNKVTTPGDYAARA